MRIRKPLMILAGLSVALLVSPQLASARDTMQPAQGGSIERRHDNEWSYGNRRGSANSHSKRRDWGQRSNVKSNKGWHRKADVIHGKKRGGFDGLPSFSGNGALPDYIKNLGTFSGSISAARDRKNGIYFYRDRSNRGGMKILTAPSSSGPSIIGVTPQSFEAACDRQGSVCVIKPR